MEPTFWHRFARATAATTLYSTTAKFIWRGVSVDVQQRTLDCLLYRKNKHSVANQAPLGCEVFSRNFGLGANQFFFRLQYFLYSLKHSCHFPKPGYFPNENDRDRGHYYSLPSHCYIASKCKKSRRFCALYFVFYDLTFFFENINNYLYAEISALQWPSLLKYRKINLILGSSVLFVCGH